MIDESRGGIMKKKQYHIEVIKYIDMNLNYQKKSYLY